MATLYNSDARTQFATTNKLLYKVLSVDRFVLRLRSAVSECYLNIHTYGPVLITTLFYVANMVINHLLFTLATINRIWELKSDEKVLDCHRANYG